MTENGLTQEVVALTEMMRAFNSRLELQANRFDRRALNTSHHGQRDYDAQYGRAASPDPRLLRARIGRHAPAHGVVTRIPNDVWKVHPIISEEGDRQTPFAREANALFDQLGLFAALQRCHKLARIFPFSLLLLGFEDAPAADPLGATSLKTPVNGRSGLPLAFVQPYSYQHVQAVSFSPAGVPERYVLTTASPAEEREAKLAIPSVTFEVHPQRLLHIVEEPLENNYVGLPILQVVWDTLDDLIKTTGGSAEMSWRRLAQRILTRFPAEVWGGDSSSPEYQRAKQAFERDLSRFIHNLTTWLNVRGADEISIESGEMVDPSGLWETLMSELVIPMGIPKNEFIGAAAGQLASAQEDSRKYASTIRGWQNNFATPLLRQLLDRLVELGTLPKPAEGYHLGLFDEVTQTWGWPPFREESDQERALTAQTRATALKTAAEAEVPLTPQEIRGYGGLGPLAEDDTPQRLERQLSPHLQTSPFEAVMDSPDGRRVVDLWREAIRAQVEQVAYRRVWREVRRAQIDLHSPTVAEVVQPLVAERLPALSESLDEESMLAALLVISLRGKDEGAVQARRPLTVVENLAARADIDRLVNERLLALLGEAVSPASDPVLAAALPQGVDGATLTAVTALLVRTLRDGELGNDRQRLEALQAGLEGVSDQRAELVGLSTAAWLFGRAQYRAVRPTEPRTKTWLPTVSQRPRPDHVAQTGLQIPFGEVFPDGSFWAGEQVNCKCGIQIGY